MSCDGGQAKVYTGSVSSSLVSEWSSLVTGVICDVTQGHVPSTKGTPDLFCP